MNSDILAQITGLSLFITSFALICNKDAFKTLIQLSKLRGFNLLIGVLFVLFGILIISLHNHWDWGSGLILTATGWIFLLEGLVRLFFVKQVTDLMIVGQAKSALLFSLYFTLFLGLSLVIISFL